MSSLVKSCVDKGPEMTKLDMGKHPHLVDSDLFRILRHMPKMGVGGPWVSGGSVWRTFNKEPLVNCDIDIFFRSKAQFEEISRRMGSLPFVNNVISETKKKWNTLYKYHVNEGKNFNKTVDVQFINMSYFSSLPKLMNSFDFTVCQFGWDGSTFYVGQTSIDDLTKKKIVLWKIAKPKSLLRHLTKYLSNGFTIPSEETYKLAYNLINMPCWVKTSGAEYGDEDDEFSEKMKKPWNGGGDLLTADDGWEGYGYAPRIAQAGNIYGGLPPTAPRTRTNRTTTRRPARVEVEEEAPQWATANRNDNVTVHGENGHLNTATGQLEPNVGGHYAQAAHAGYVNRNIATGQWEAAAAGTYGDDVGVVVGQHPVNPATVEIDINALRERLANMPGLEEVAQPQPVPEPQVPQFYLPETHRPLTIREVVGGDVAVREVINNDRDIANEAMHVLRAEGELINRVGETERDQYTRILHRAEEVMERIENHGHIRPPDFVQDTPAVGRDVADDFLGWPWNMPTVVNTPVLDTPALDDNIAREMFAEVAEDPLGLGDLTE